MIYLLYKNMLEGVTLYIQIFGDLTLLFVLNLNNPILGLQDIYTMVERLLIDLILEFILIQLKGHGESKKI